MQKTCDELEALPLDKISIKEIELALHSSCNADERYRLSELLRWKQKLLLCDEMLKIIESWRY